MSCELDGVSQLYVLNPKGEPAYTITDSNRNYTIDYAGPDRISYVTNTAPDNSYSVAITRYGTNVSHTAYDSINNQLSSVSYAYDAHGRPCKFTDARTGTTSLPWCEKNERNRKVQPAPTPPDFWQRLVSIVAIVVVGRSRPERRFIENDTLLSDTAKDHCPDATVAEWN